MGDDVVVVNDDREVGRTESAELAHTCHELDGDLCGEGPEHLAFRHVYAPDGDVVYPRLGEHVGIEHHTDLVGHTLDALHLLQSAAHGERVAEVSVVEGLGVDDADAVEAFLRGIDVDAVGPVFDVGDEVEMFGQDASAPPYGHTLAQSVVEEELNPVGFGADNLCRRGQLLVCHALELGRRDGDGVLRAHVVLEVELDGTQPFTVHIAQEHKALVAQSDAHGVGGVRREDHVLRHVDYAHGDFQFLLVCLVERHHEPEDAGEREKEQKNQELPVH